jgi:hypothetical protein
MGLGVFAVVLAATAYPPAMALHREGVLGAFRYFASDAFYYLSVANHSAGRPFFSFDGTHPTNGFHPLWQWYLERAFALFDLGEREQIIFIAVSGIVLVSIGTALFATVLLRLTRRPWLALIGAAPGVYYLLVPTVDAHHFAQWSFANGMESPLSIFFFGLLVAGLFGRGRLRADGSLASIVLLSTVLSAVVLTRLDDVFIFVPFVLWAAVANGSVFESASRRAGLRRIAAMVFVPVVAIGAYLAYNALYTGSLLPSSGAAKWQPLWALGRNLYALWITALPFADPLGRGAVAWTSEAWRVLQMLVPAVAASAWLLAQPMGRGRDEPSREIRENRLIGLLAVYVLCKAAYNFSMVGIWQQGQWYYPLSIMVFNLICVVWAARWLDQRVRVRITPGAGTLIASLRDRWPSIERASGAIAVFGTLMLVLVSANAFVDMIQSSPHPSRNFTFWTERGEVRQLLDRTCPGCGVLEFDDGIVSYSLDRTSTLNGLGLAMDRQAQEALEQGRLLEVAWQRGHRVFTTVNYEMPRAAYTDPRRLRESLARNDHFADQDLEAWDFELAFESPASQVVFVRFGPRGTTGESGAYGRADTDRSRATEYIDISGELPTDPAHPGDASQILRMFAPRRDPSIRLPATRIAPPSRSNAAPRRG